MTLFVVILLPTVVALGIWQVNRGAQKRALESAYLQTLTQLPVKPAQISPEVEFQRVRLEGEFSDEVFLLDNQVLDGRVGYWVVQVFNHERDKFLVNRGFVPAGDDRSTLPTIESPQGRQRVIGSVWPFTGLLPVWREDALDVDSWPKRIQRLDIQTLAEVTGAQALEIRLEPGQPGVHNAAPFARVLNDAKHRGYAATWFGLAITLTLAYVVFGVFRAREHRG